MGDGCRSGTSVELETAREVVGSVLPSGWQRGPDLETYCAEINWFAASADIRLNSPAMTAAQIILARRRALAPGSVGCAPATPKNSSMAN
jgi:hypothetical protein